MSLEDPPDAVKRIRKPVDAGVAVVVSEGLTALEGLGEGLDGAAQAATTTGRSARTAGSRFRVFSLRGFYRDVSGWGAPGHIE